MRQWLKKRLLKWLGVETVLTNLIAENNNIKRRMRELEGLSSFNRRF